MAVIRSYHCPGCRNSISPKIGLITKPFVQCRHCPTRVYVSRDMVIDNWSRNVYLLCALLIWFGFTVHALTSAPAPGLKASPGGLAMGTLLIGWLAGLICALPIIPVGYVLGHVAALLVAKGPPQPVYAPPGRYGAGYVPQEHEWR